MTFITGEDAAIDGMTCLQRFMIEKYEPEDNAEACSATGGAVVRADANKDWRGVAVGFGHTPAKMPGELFTFTGVDRDGMGHKSTANGAIVDSVRIFCKSQQSKFFFYQIAFSANGALNAGSYSVSDAASPNPVPSIQKNISIADVAQTGILEWDLELVAKNAKPVWPAELLGWPNRAKGNIDATLTWVQGFNDPSVLQTLGAFANYKLYVTETLFWELQWAKMRKLPIDYPIADSDGQTDWIAAKECQAHYSGWLGGVQGYIKKPAGTNVWPI